ncbi:lipopolysaccharide transport system permease protein [Candidatus Electrothrix communis]|uniref:Transport permease protein n=1 Tax=Candidatus Electrothrix communis TaxID=1859133 RepID=A0A3S3QMU6_9BACT|nr:lipopolysaccharide transport system permease protein [Candidatus Electrothrix communis]
MVIKPKTGWFDIHLGEIWRYRDLIGMFVKRDFVTMYKQTILGPFWFIIQPLFTTLVFTIIFGKVAKIPTDDIPPFLFYLSGNVAWGYFATCLGKTSDTFNTNAAIFGKVYFPRLTVPISSVVSSLLQFGIQFILFLGFYFYFMAKGAPLSPKMWIVGLPVLLLQMALLGFGMGVLISSMTTKYKDLRFAMGFVTQLWMYATPIVYPLTLVPDWLRPWYVLNPMVSVVESFRYAFLGSGIIAWGYVGIGWFVTLVILFIGILLFSRVEKTFMDTV